MIHCHDSWISRFARKVEVLPHPHHLPFSILCSPSILCLCFKMFQVFVSQMPQIIPEKTSSTSMSYASNTSSISGEAINLAEWTFGLPWHWSHLQRSRCGVGWWWRGLWGGSFKIDLGWCGCCPKNSTSTPKHTTGYQLIPPLQYSWSNNLVSYPKWLFCFFFPKLHEIPTIWRVGSLFRSYLGEGRLQAGMM